PPAASASSTDDSDDARRSARAPRPRKPHTYKDRLHKPRARPPGVAGTNVHSSIAGISTSNALAKLTPPPADARPGSKWAPWMKLTEYEMAVLRKQMKKNAVWTPSLTMVNRELERKHRTRRDYEREKARCDAAGELLLDEEPETLLQIATAQGVDDPALAAPASPADGLDAPAEHASAREESLEAADRPTPLDTRRKKARGALRALEDATKTIQDAADGLKELTFSAHAVTTPPTSAQRKRSLARPGTTKRKRDTTPASTAEGTAEPGNDPDDADNDASSQQPEPKRPRLQLIAPAPPRDRTPSTPAPASAAASVSKDQPTPVGPSPVPETPERLPDTSPGTVQVPLAPAGPSTPKVQKPESSESSRQATPVQPSPAAPRRSSPIVPVPAPEPAPAQPALTAASTRSQRKSITPKHSSPPPAEPSRPTRSTVSALGRPTSPEATIALRPRSSRSHVPTPKAQSEEPKPNEGRPIRDGRRHSIFSQPALTAPAPTRVSARRKPPPKGEVTSAENGQKTVTNVKRSQGNKNNKRRKNEGQPELVEEVDSDEERYCICDDVSYGQMISCDNNCDKEWFHFECVGMTQMPARRAKWYCPDCREKLRTDAFGNPKVPPSLPGRSRGNR
ncbi:phd finger domain-containing protein, partial [Stagonosporopsis vannaccii]